MTPGLGKKRALPTRAVRATMVVAVAASMSTRISVSAFMAVDNATPVSSFSSIALRPHQSKVLFSSTKLFANKDDGDDDETMLTIETVIDANRHTLLHPTSDPKRPVLVDAFAPWCGPCKILDKVLRKSQPQYLNKVDFCRWNVNDKENTEELKQLFLDSGYTLTKLPSLIVFREGKPVAVRPGLANAFQLDDFLEKTLPDVLERTFDEDGVKMVMMVQKDMETAAEKTNVMEDKKAETQKVLAEMSKVMMMGAVKAASADEEKVVVAETATPTVNMQGEVDMKVLKEKDLQVAQEELIIDDCITPEECWERVEKTIWQDRIVIPAMDGIMLPARSQVSP